jgi:hypothetical protein
MTTTPVIFTFNGKEYNSDQITDKARALVSLVQKAQEQLDLYSISKESLLASLAEELEGKEEVVKPRPAPAVKAKPAVAAE